MKQTRSSSSLGEAPAPLPSSPADDVHVFTVGSGLFSDPRYVTLVFRASSLADPEPLIRRTFVAALREGTGQMIAEGLSVSASALARLSVSIALEHDDVGRRAIIASLAEAGLRPSRGFDTSSGFLPDYVSLHAHAFAA